MVEIFVIFRQFVGVYGGTDRLDWGGNIVPPKFFTNGAETYTVNFMIISFVLTFRTRIKNTYHRIRLFTFGHYFHWNVFDQNEKGPMKYKKKYMFELFHLFCFNISLQRGINE